jgi:hypothetical protein
MDPAVDLLPIGVRGGRRSGSATGRRSTKTQGGATAATAAGVMSRRRGVPRSSRRRGGLG